MTTAIEDVPVGQRFGIAVDAELERQDRSMSWLCRTTGINRDRMRRMREPGGRSPTLAGPTLAEVQAIACALEVDVAKLANV